MWKSREFSSVFGSTNFLSQREELIKGSACQGNMNDAKFILHVYRMLVLRLVESVASNLESLIATGFDKTEAKDQNQFFQARDLSLAFIEATVLDRFIQLVDEEQWTNEERKVLSTLAALFGVWSLEKHIGHLFRLGIFVAGDRVKHIQDTIVRLCADLVPNAVALADILAPTDFVLNSALGHSSGDVYGQLQSAFYSDPGCFARTKIWPEITQKYRSKL